MIVNAQWTHHHRQELLDEEDEEEEDEEDEEGYSSDGEVVLRATRVEPVRV